MVKDFQNTSTPLIYQTEFNNYNLEIGDNILSQLWGQKAPTASFLKDGNRFRYFVLGVRINIYVTSEYTLFYFKQTY